MTSPTRLSTYLEQLPPKLARWSKAFLRACHRQALDLARAVQQALKYLRDKLVKPAKDAWIVLVRLVNAAWLAYYRFESAALRTAVDVGLALFALRYFLLFVAIGIALAITGHWIILLAYTTFLVVSAVNYFQSDASEDETHAAHQELRSSLVRVFRWPLRLLITLVASAAIYIVVGYDWTFPDISTIFL